MCQLRARVCPGLTVLSFAVATFIGFVQGAHAQNLLVNPSFEQVGPLGPVTTFTGTDFVGPSAANRWTLFNNYDGTTSSESLPSTLPSGGPTMIRVVVTSGDNGLVQTFLTGHTGPERITASAWVYAVQGAIYMSVGDGGGTPRYGVTTQHVGQWELLETVNGGSPANEIIFYSASGPAEFYLDSVSVSIPAVPGDADYNGVLDLRDAVMAARLVHGLDQGDSASDRADVAPWIGTGGRVHGDGALDVQDIVVLLRVWGGLLN